MRRKVNDNSWKNKDPFKKSEALEVVITEKIVMEFMQRKNEWKEPCIQITKMNLFAFWRFVQEKRNKLDQKYFEK